MSNSTIHAVNEAARILGTKAALANALGVTPAAVNQWMIHDGPNGRGVPIKQCVRIEQLTNGSVTRIQLRPDDWKTIWPELATSPTTQPHAAEQGV